MENALLLYSNNCNDDRNKHVLAYIAENKKLLLWRIYSLRIRVYLEAKLWWRTLINSNNHIRYTCTIIIKFVPSVQNIIVRLFH